MTKSNISSGRVAWGFTSTVSVLFEPERVRIGAQRSDVDEMLSSTTMGWSCQLSVDLCRYVRVLRAAAAHVGMWAGTVACSLVMRISVEAQTEVGLVAVWCCR